MNVKLSLLTHPVDGPRAVNETLTGIIRAAADAVECEVHTIIQGGRVVAIALVSVYNELDPDNTRDIRIRILREDDVTVYSSLSKHSDGRVSGLTVQGETLFF